MTEAEKKAAEELEAKRVEAIKSAVKDQIDPLKAEIKTATEKNAELQEKLAKAEGKLELIEKSPVFQGPAIRRSQEYKGYKLSKMLVGGAEGGRNLRDIFSAKGAGFGALATEEGQDEYAKLMIDIIKGLDRPNRPGCPEAKKSMAERMETFRKTNQINEGTASEGGYLVAPEYQWDIIKLARNRSYALQLCRVVNMVSNTQYVPTEATHGVSTWEAEAATKTSSEPTFGQVRLDAKKNFCLARITNEELADTSVDLVGLLTEQFAYATGQELDSKMLLGTGSPWSGLLSTVTQSVILAAGGSVSTLTFTDLSNVIAQIVEARLEGASWLVSRGAKHYIRSLKDTQGRPVFAMPGNGVPGTIWEYPYYQSEKMPNVDSVSNKQILFGNFNYAILGRRKGAMTIDVDPYGLFDSDMVRFRMTTRWAFANADASAFCMVKTAAS